VVLQVYGKERGADAMTEPAGRFDPALAEELSLVVHTECKDVPHDIGMRLAVVAHSFYSMEVDGEELNSELIDAWIKAMRRHETQV